MHKLNVSILYRQSIKLLHQKAVEGVDQPMKALPMHIQKPYKGKLSKFSHSSQLLIAVILSKIIFSEGNSFMHMFNVSALSRQSIKMLHQKLW